MSENSFDASNIEPARVGLIEEQKSTEEQLPESTLPDDSTPAAAQAAPVEQQLEVQAGADSEVFKNLQSAFTKVTQENSELRNQLASMNDRLNNISAPTHQNSFEKPTQQSQPDALDAVDSEFPELKPVNARVRQLEEQLKRQNAQMQNYQRDYTEGRQQTAQQLHDQKILSAHPDAYDISGTPDFTGWLARQPVYMQRLTAEGNADDIISLISTYKQASSARPTKVEAARRVAAPNTGSAPVKTLDSNKPTFTGQQIADMSDAEFIRREAEIQEAQMEGRVFS